MSSDDTKQCERCHTPLVTDSGHRPDVPGPVVCAECYGAMPREEQAGVIFFSLESGKLGGAVR